MYTTVLIVKIMKLNWLKNIEIETKQTYEIRIEIQPNRCLCFLTFLFSLKFIFFIFYIEG